MPYSNNSDNAKLFDALERSCRSTRLSLVSRRQFEDLRAAKANYVERSIDHMLKGLILMIDDLVSQQTKEELQKDLGAVNMSTGFFSGGTKP